MKVKLIIPFLLFAFNLSAQNSWIRINQLGYLTGSAKGAVYVSKEDKFIDQFEIVNAKDDRVVFMSNKVAAHGEFTAFKTTFRLTFSDFKKEGEYYIKVDDVKSPVFRIANDVYDGTADFILQYMRQQRCGYNPFLKDSCHLNDGFIVDHPTRTGEYIDVTGGWHDATDYLQYLTTSANAVYQLLFAYQQNPEAFGDKFDKDGNKGNNGIPDILDEAKWGLDWLYKMNPEPGVIFNQIADDRDHAGFRLPNKDSVNYGMPKGRPVYFVTGRQQGLSKYKNRSTGVSSTAGKYASSFALGSVLLKEHYPEFAAEIEKKAAEAYEFAKSDLGVNQTASNKSPYFYEEDNYIDDMELAAAQLFKTTNEAAYLTEAVDWGKVEPVTPWMGTDTARHYQWYPFMNVGHYILMTSAGDAEKKRFSGYYWKGLNLVHERGQKNAFLIGIPFIWCSNNLVAAMVTQAHLYRTATGDNRFAEMEGALRDWLFGCNPWGTSMIVGLPEEGDSPTDPHSSLWLLHQYQTTGGLVDGPIYNNIFKYLAGLQIVNGDEYAEFQSDYIVYHDDYGDYSTNEPTMDGTASLSYFLSAMEKEGKKYEEGNK